MASRKDEPLYSGSNPDGTSCVIGPDGIVVISIPVGSVPSEVPLNTNGNPVLFEGRFVSNVTLDVPELNGRCLCVAYRVIAVGTTSSTTTERTIPLSKEDKTRLVYASSVDRWFIVKEMNPNARLRKKEKQCLLKDAYLITVMGEHLIKFFFDKEEFIEFDVDGKYFFAAPITNRRSVRYSRSAFVYVDGNGIEDGIEDDIEDDVLDGLGEEDDDDDDDDDDDWGDLEDDDDDWGDLENAFLRLR